MITITKQLITPMLRLVLDWEPVANAVSYTIKLRRANADTPVEETTTSMPYRVEQPLRNATWYHMQIIALDESAAQLQASAVVTFWTSAQGGTAPLLRQATFDALHSAGLSMVDDGYFQPRAFGKTAAPSVSLPAIEVGMPSLSASEPFSGDTKLMTWQVPINVLVAHDQGDPDRDSGAWLLFELAQSAVDDSDGLKLTALGVLPEQWSWSASLATKGSRSKTTVIEAQLTVPVRKPTGVILIPQPATVPDQPEAPDTL